MLELKTLNFVYGPAHLNKYEHIQLTTFNTLLSSKLKG